MSKEYNSLSVSESDKGKVLINDDVLKLAIFAATSQVNGVYETENKFIEALTNKKKDIFVETHNGKAVCKLSITVYHGYNVITVSENVQDAIIESLKKDFNIENVIAHVTVKGLAFRENEE